MSPTVPLAEYLFTRLRQLGVESIHGVPGDYNLALLDYVVPNGLHWVGNCNELNAGYAADAYSRIKGLGAIITTFGVGELSAANAIAGAYCELAPVVHIVGTPARHLQESRALIHHTLSDGVYNHFSQMATQITVAQANLQDPRTCPQLIDATIQQCLVHSRPVYIQLPADMVSIHVDAERLRSKIEIPPALSSKDEQAAIDLVLDRIYCSKQPMILVDGESRAYGILDEVEQLIKKTQWPTWITVFGKSCVDESIPNVHGIWQGDYADQAENDYINSCDLVVCFGPHFTNTNTYAYTSIPNTHISIFVTARAVKAGDRTIRDLPAKHFLSSLLKRLDPSKAKKSSSFPVQVNGPLADPKTAADGLITQDHFYTTFGKKLREGDIILAETGTAGHGCREFKLPRHTHLFKPSTWLSIGYMLPATQGAALAQHQLDNAGKWPRQNNKPPRTVLLIGDGSFQMTAQELSTIIKLKLNLLLILINNDGYTIERCLHGWNQDYNNIAFWRYLEAPSFFGADMEKGSGYHAETTRVSTWGELDKALQDDGGEPKLKMIEVMMDKEDAPITLSTLLQNQKDAAKKSNSA